MLIRFQAGAVGPSIDAGSQGAHQNPIGSGEKRSRRAVGASAEKHAEVIVICVLICPDCTCSYILIIQ